MCFAHETYIERYFSCCVCYVSLAFVFDSCSLVYTFDSPTTHEVNNNLIFGIIIYISNCEFFFKKNCLFVQIFFLLAENPLFIDRDRAMVSKNSKNKPCFRCSKSFRKILTLVVHLIKMHGIIVIKSLKGRRNVSKKITWIVTDEHDDYDSFKPNANSTLV